MTPTTEILRALASGEELTAIEIFGQGRFRHLQDVTDLLKSKVFRGTHFIERISHGNGRWAGYRLRQMPAIHIRVGQSLRQIEQLAARTTLEFTRGRRDMAKRILGVGEDKFRSMLGRP